MLIFRRRLSADFPQMLALAVGVLVMTAILAGAPMYLKTIESLGLRSTLATLSPTNRNMQIVVEQLPLTARSVNSASEQVDVALAELGDLVVHVGQQSQTRPFFWTLDPESDVGGPNPDLAVLHRFDDFLSHVEVVAGGTPDDRVEAGETHSIIEVVVPVARAERLGVAVGDEVWLTASPVDAPSLMARVVGSFEPEDVDAEFWLGLAEQSFEPGRPSPGAREMLPMFTARDVLFDAVTGGQRSIGVNRWLVQLDPNLLERQTPSTTADQVDAVGHELRRGLPESVLISALENPLRALEQKISFARIPSLMMGGVLLLAAGYYSIMAAGSLVARRRVDTTRMYARGVGRWQITRMFVPELVLLVVVPALVAPLIAYASIELIGNLPEYGSVTSEGEMPVRLGFKSYVWSLVGAVLVALYLLGAVVRSAGQVVDAAQTSSRRVERRPFYQRQYLDVLVFLFGGVVLWDLSTEASVASAVEGTEAVAQVNPLLVFAPAIFLAVALLLSLRVLPPLATVVSGGFSRRGPVWAHMISSLFARVPITYAWPTAILGMAAGTAMLSATVAATLQQGSVDQADYEVGADLRVFPVDLSSGGRSAILGDLRKLDGVNGVSGGLRTTGDVRSGGQGTPFEFLAIEPGEFSNVGKLRSDFSDTDSENLFSDLSKAEPDLPLSVPADAVRLGYRLRADTVLTKVTASIRIRDKNGLSHSVNFGEVRGTNWNVRMGEIPSLAVPPVEVVGLTFFELTPNGLGTPVSMQVDDLMYELPSGETVVIETFADGATGWNPLASSEGTDTSTSQVSYRRVVDGSRVVDTGLQIDLGVGTDLGIRGAVRSNFEVIPIVFSESALIANDLAVGDQAVINVFERSIPVEVVGSASYFPTLDPDDGGFGIVDLDQVWSHLMLSGSNSAGVAQEVFIGLSRDADEFVIESVSSEIGGLHNVVSQDELQESSVATPLAVAGWRGASIVTAVLAVILAVLGFLTFSPNRPAGDQFNLAVLRSLGVRKRGLILISALEQLLVVSIGVGAGVVTGYLMARLAVDTASQTGASVEALPPFVFSTDWSYLYGLIGILVGVALIVLVFDVVGVRRINVANTVRNSGKSG